MKDETFYKIFKTLEENPETCQRQLAKELGVSLGKINYCLKALLDKGLVKIETFCTSKSKKAYIYKVTSAGIKEKAAVTMRFLKFKMQEYETIKMEIDRLKNEIHSSEENA